VRKALAYAILAMAAGLYVEAQLPDGQLKRAPLTGGVMMGSAALVWWAMKELGIEGSKECQRQLSVS
jgi:hypothetical protein